MRKLVGEMLGVGRIKTASIVTLSHFLVAATTLLQSIVLARILPLPEFGLLAATIAIAATADAAIHARGSETSLAVFSSSKATTSEERARLARELFSIDLAWSACAYAIFLGGTLIYDWLSGSNSKLLYTLILSGFVSFPWATAKGYITVYLSARKFAPIEVSYAATAFVVGLGLAYYLGAWGFVLGMLAASIMQTIVGLWAMGFNPVTIFIGPRSSGEIARKTIWWFGLTGTIRSLLINGLQQFDLLLLAALTSPSTVGLYRAAKTVSGIPQRLGQPVWVLLKRSIIHGADQRRPAYARDPVVLTSALLLLLGILVMPALVLYADEGMAFLFGPEFAPAGTLLWWLLPAAWLMYGVTGWFSTFGSISKRRIVVIAIHLGQLAIILVATALGRGTVWSVAIGVAVSQVCAAGAFWLIYLVNRRVATTETESDPAP